MKEDPQYREKVLSLIQRDLGDSYAPRNCSVLITVGVTLNKYRADSWPVGYDSEFDVRSQNSFYKRMSEKKDRQKVVIRCSDKCGHHARTYRRGHGASAR